MDKVFPGLIRLMVLRWGGFPGDSVGGGPACNAGGTVDLGSVPGSGRFSGGGRGNPLQDSCLENPTDRGAWRAMVHGVAKVPKSDTAEKLSTCVWTHSDTSLTRWPQSLPEDTLIRVYPGLSGRPDTMASILTRGTQAEPGQGSGGLVKLELYPGATRPPARMQGHQGREGQEDPPLWPLETLLGSPATRG